MTGATSASIGEDGKIEEGKQAPVVQEAQQIITDEHDQSTKSSTKAKTIKRVVSSILPHIEPLQWTTFFCLSVWCSIPTVIYIILFTVRTFTHHDGYLVFKPISSVQVLFVVIFSSVNTANRIRRFILLRSVSNVWRICISICWELSNSWLLLLYIRHW
jgi:hypothetical protein